jgi:hypothetical protein
MSEKNKRVSEKISLLRREGEPEDQAVATALSMERKHRLGRGGKYRHVKRSKKRSSRRR